MVTIDRRVRVLAADQCRQPEHDPALSIAAVGQSRPESSVDLCIRRVHFDGAV